MRALKSIIYTPHPSPLPAGEGIFRGFYKALSVAGFATPPLTFCKLLRYLNVQAGVANPGQLQSSPERQIRRVPGWTAR